MGLLDGRDQTIFGVTVEKYVDRVPRLQAGADVFGGHQDLAQIGGVQVDAVRGFAENRQRVSLP